MFAFCSSVVKIDQFRLLRNGIFSNAASFALKEREIREVQMTTQYSWLESYMTALLETDWKKMRERMHAAEAEIGERQRVLSEDHGGWAEERQAIVDAINSMNALRSVATDWKNRQGL